MICEVQSAMSRVDAQVHPDSTTVAETLWDLVTTIMGQAKDSRGQAPEVDYEEYLDFMDGISAADLTWFLIGDAQDVQRALVDIWLDDQAEAQEEVATA